MRVVVVALALLTCIVPAAAQQGGFRIYGYGARQCSDFITDVKGDTNKAISYFSWAQGYMSRRNSEEKTRSGRDVDLAPKTFDLDEQFKVMATFCMVNEAQPFVASVEAVYERLRALDALAS